MSAHRADGQRVRLAHGDDAVLATAGGRLLARALDVVVVAIPYLGVLLVAVGLPRGLPAIGLVGLGLVSLLIGYEVLLTTWQGATFGKRLTGIVIADQSGGRPQVRQVAVRSLVLLGPVFVPVIGQLYLLCCVVSAMRDERFKRGWPDRAAGTLVLLDP